MVCVVRFRGCFRTGDSLAAPTARLPVRSASALPGREAVAPRYSLPLVLDRPRLLGSVVCGRICEGAAWGSRGGPLCSGRVDFSRRPHGGLCAIGATYLMAAITASRTVWLTAPVPPRKYTLRMVDLFSVR